MWDNAFEGGGHEVGECGQDNTADVEVVHADAVVTTVDGALKEERRIATSNGTAEAP